MKPGTPGSIPVYTFVGLSEPLNDDTDVCTEGLKTFNERVRTGENIIRENTYVNSDEDHDNYIYFRAPFHKLPKEWATRKMDELFIYLYGKSRRATLSQRTDITNLVTINIDPTATQVFDSSARIFNNGRPNMSSEEAFQKQLQEKKQKLAKTETMIDYLKHPSDEHEVIVKRPIIPSEWFSSCLKQTTKGTIPIVKRRRNAKTRKNKRRR